MKTRRKQKLITKISAITAFLLVLAVFFAVAKLSGHDKNLKVTTQPATQTKSYSMKLSDIPDFSGSPYVVINNNKPDFKNAKTVNKSYERYGALDSLGRCTKCEACVGRDLMPTGERGSISSVKPTGWQKKKYSFINGKNLYNRCHLIAYQLTGEDANPQNLITGTRYMNTSGMLPFEDKVAEFVKATGQHVLYRVTPVFNGDELVARGVHMEALSVEDNGKSIQFNVYCYNVQPGVEIDYASGDSWESGKERPSAEKNSNEKSTEKKEESTENTSSQSSDGSYVLNIKSKKFHKPDCPSVNRIKPENKKTVNEPRSELIKEGYTPCGSCNP